MDTKEYLVNNIKEWLKNDTEISKLQSEIKERRAKKKALTEILMNTMKQNDIDCFDINGGSLIYKKTTSKKPINSKSLIVALQTFYSSNPSQAEQVTKFIMEHREDQTKETVVRKIDK
jgi:hypothetical protein